MFYSCFVKHGLNLFSSWELFKPILVGFKFSTLKIQVTNHLNPKQNSLFSFSISDFHSAKLSLTKHVLLVSIIGKFLLSYICIPISPEIVSRSCVNTYRNKRVTRPSVINDKVLFYDDQKITITASVILSRLLLPAAV